MLEILEEARREAPALEHVVVAPWDEEVAGHPGTLEPLAVDAEHPYLLTYTSGTTGKPKGVLHVQGGFLVSIAREACYQADARPDDVVHFSTDMGWIMGPWTVRRLRRDGRDARLRGRGARLAARPALAAGRGGARDDPRLLADAGARADPARRARRPTCRRCASFVTTGEPWNPEPVPLALRAGRRRRACPIVNITGGTEVGAVFLGSSIARADQGVLASAGRRSGWRWTWSIADGQSLVGTGEVGELVCRKPFPGMTRGFWGDPERYLETYWRRFPGIWTHGDWASVDADGYWFLHGRSDDTLNIAGKRIGPAEIESAAVAHPAVTEAAAVGVPHEVKGEVAWVFCVLAPGRSASADDVADLVAADLGKAFAPDRVVFVVRAAEDPLGQDRPAGGPRDRARHRSGRPLLGREPRGARGDRARRSVTRF